MPLSEAVLDEIVRKVDLDNSRFIPLRYQDQGETKEVFVYPEPMGVLGKFELISNYIKNGAIVGLKLPEQLVLQNKFEERFSIETRLGSLKENLEAAYSEETRIYRDKVLHHQVYTGEIAIKQDDSGRVNLRRILGVKSENIRIPKPSSQTFIDETGKEILALQEKEEIEQLLKYNLSQTLQTEMVSTAIKSGHFDDFNVVPTDKDLKPEGRGYWIEKEFGDKGLSAIWCGWFRPRPGLLAGSHGFFKIGPGFVIRIWTDQNPKK